MKKYITPNTECQDFLQGGILCHSRDGEDQMNTPDPNQDTPHVF